MTRWHPCSITIDPGNSTRMGQNSPHPAAFLDIQNHKTSNTALLLTAPDSVGL